MNALPGLQMSLAKLCKMEIGNVGPDEPQRPADVADYILHCHAGDAKEAINAMIEEIEHLQRQLDLAVAAMGHGFTRGWVPKAYIRQD